MSMKSIARLFVVFALLNVASCSKESATSKEGAPAPAAVPEQVAKASAGHAPSNVKPGSYEDWCEEHQVPESQCTLCNPTLSAAFKATGDWCEEHGLPESHCRKCHPDLKIVRPAKAN